VRVVTTRSTLSRSGVIAGFAVLALAASACGSSSSTAASGSPSSSSSSAAMTAGAMTSGAKASAAMTTGAMTSGSASPAMSSGAGSSVAAMTGSAATATSAAAMGGMDALVAAANKEGALNVIALPPDWSDYKEVIAGFQAKYPQIKLTSQQPDDSSAQEIQAAVTTKGTSQAPDVFDIGAAVTLASLDHFAPYKVAAWGDIPAANKDANGLWVNDYTGVMTVGYNADVLGKDMTSLEDLKNPALKGAVALDGDPTQANEGLLAVVFASVANGGSLDDISKGVDFFHSLKTAGTLSTAKASLQLVSAGKVNAIVGWSFNQLPITAAGSANGFTWKTFTPKGVNIGAFYNQAINKDAPHPAAARLWQEYLYTAQAQNYWIKGGALPILYSSMQKAGTIDTTAAKNLPVIQGDVAQMTSDQTTKANAYIKANWAKAIS
jgi:putative spermidine/putrescine transport system substrate-binding protein